MCSKPVFLQRIYGDCKNIEFVKIKKDEIYTLYLSSIRDRKREKVRKKEKTKRRNQYVIDKTLFLTQFRVESNFNKISKIFKILLWT